MSLFEVSIQFASVDANFCRRIVGGIFDILKGKADHMSSCNAYCTLLNFYSQVINNTLVCQLVGGIYIVNASNMTHR